MNTMKHPRIDDDKIVDRYLGGRLSSADEQLFEEHLFECADCLEKVEAGEEMRRGLQAVAAEDAARASLSLGLIAWLRSRRPTQLAGFAALAAALVLLPAVVVWQQTELRRVREIASIGSGLAEPLTDVLVISLGLVRDGEPVEIRPDPDKRAVLLSLELPMVSADRYRVTLYDEAGESRWSGDGLEPSLYDNLVVILPSSYLVPGDYRLDIEAVSAAGTESAGEMRFRVPGPEDR